MPPVTFFIQLILSIGFSVVIYNYYMQVNRYDYSDFKATKTDEGFLVDSPIVARTGIQEYRRADGSLRRELRLPEEVFSAESLASMRGKVITVDHPASGRVDSKSAHRVTVGMILSSGLQDGEHVRTDISIHNPDAIGDRRELSLGYSAHLDETPGEHPTYGAYDAIQRNIRVNHLSVVRKGRAGVARLNMDSDELADLPEQIFNQQEQQTMTVKVKLDNGIEYDAAPEVSVELHKLRTDAAAVQSKLDSALAERDTLQAKVDGIPDQLKAAQIQGRADSLERMRLEVTAEKFKVDHAEKSNREIKEAVIKSIRKDADLSGKSDFYIDAAYDLSVIDAPNLAMASQRVQANTRTDAQQEDSASARDRMLKRLHNKESA